MTAFEKSTVGQNLSIAIFALSILWCLPLERGCRQFLFHPARTLLEANLCQLTIKETVTLYGVAARERISPFFKKAGVPYPPSEVMLVGLKEEKLLIVLAKDAKDNWKQIKGYPVVGTSGKAGPKLKEGDLQVPEGFYKISGLYPNSIAHLGLRINYPNAQDRAHGKADRRTKLGGDILIHGSYWSTGCLAMGNVSIEEIYMLAHDTGCSNVQLILAPCDLRSAKPKVDFKQQPKWVPALYQKLTEALKSYPISIDPSWSANLEDSG